MLKNKNSAVFNNSFSLRLSIYLLFLACSSVSSFSITCNYSEFDWNNWGDRYTCSASMGDVYRPGIKVNNVIGEHIGSYTNLDVRGVEIHNQKTYYLIRRLTDFFPNMTDLYVFRSDIRRIARSDFTDYQHQLETLSLSRNRITFVPTDAFDDLVRLEYLSLSFNALTSVPNLKALKNLKELYLFENSIAMLLPSAFEGNEKLEVIWLYYNKIIYIDPAGVFDYAPHLKYADLTNNRCIDMKYRGRIDDEAFNEVIKNKCQLAGVTGRLYDFNDSQ